MSADLNTVKMAIRAVLQCNKHGLQTRKLIADYKELNGSFIPFKVFGFKTIEDFLRSIPDTVSVVQRGQDTFVQFTQCADTAHIEKLVRGQRTNKKKPQRAHAPKPLSSRRYHNHEGPARRETTVPRFHTRNRTSNYQNRANQNSSNRIDLQQRQQAAVGDWDATPVTPKPNTITDNRARTNFQSRTQSQDEWDASPVTVKPQNDWGASNASSPTSPPWSALSSTKPRGAPITSHFPALTPRDRQQQQPRPANNSAGENFRTQRNSPRDNHSPLQRQSDSFSSYSTNVLPERTVVFENQNEISRNNSGTGNAASTRPQHIVKPDIRITRRDTGITVVRNQSISSGSRASSPSQTFKTHLADLISEKQLNAPKYKSLGYSDKHSKRMQYLGIVEVGESKWLSHPSSYPTPEEAEEEAARKAYEQLKSQNSVAETGTINTDKLLSDIADILSTDKYKLMFHNGVEKNYKEKFQKSLPLNWLEIVGNSPRFEVERKEYTNKVVITVGLNTKKDNVTSSQTSTTPPEGESATDFGITDQQLIDAQAMPDSLVLPGTETWDVIVTKVIAANEVIVRLYETSDKYVDLLNDMHAYYTENPKPVKEVVVGKIYAAKFDEVTYRVHVQRVDQNEVSCFFVDEGGDEKLSMSLLHELLPKYLALPFQAFSCLLTDLKYCASSILGRDYLEDIVNKLNGSVLVAMPTHREDPIEVKLYDTSNPDDRDLNDELIQYLKSHYYDDFFKPGVESPVAVMNVSDTGDFQVQIMDRHYHRLEAAQTSVNTTCAHKLTRTPTLEELNSILPQICCYSLFEGNWYRAEVLEAHSEDKIKVVYPDYGNEEEVNISNLRFVDSTLDPLHCIPYLVSSKCRLDNVPNDSKLKWCKKTTAKYEEIIGVSASLTMKVIHNASNLSPPLIELFVTINNDPIVVNMKLAACKDVFEVIAENGEESRRESLPDILKPIVAPLTNGVKSEDDQNHNGSEHSETSVASTSAATTNMNRLSISGDDYVVGSNDPIADPILPKIVSCPAGSKDYFDVFVTLAANPDNFTVTPYINSQEGSEMAILNDEMYTFYETPENTIELNANMIKRGQFLAAKWTDDNWYRVRVETIVEKEPLVLMCYFIDYGDIHTINFDKIQPLFGHFRKLPMQAIKASLANVTPLNADWEVISCHQFAKKVEQKAFVSTVTEIVMDKDNRPTLKLILCDTSDETDVVINDWLVQENHAKKKG